MLRRGATVSLLAATTITVALLTSLTTAGDSTSCDGTCGNSSSPKHVNYPFGFSPGCPIRLDCTNETGEISIDQFQVLNITGSSIFIDLPTKCDRPINSIMPLFSSHYSLTRTNGLILQDCKAPLGGCFEKTWFLDTRFGNCTGNHKGDNVSCFSANITGTDVIRYEVINSTRCEYILSSIAAAEGNLLRFEAVELGWWLNGTSGNICAANASTEKVELGSGKAGFRCHCDNGFEGDGFLNGTGCRIALSGCGGSNYFCHHGGRTLGILVGGFVAGVSVISGLAVICFFIRRHSTSLRNRMSAKRLLCEAAGNRSVPLYTYKDIERATNGFSERQRLGNGAYGTVYAGRLHDDELVAIKRIRRQDANSADQVTNEIKLLSSISHPNLVRLLGCCIENGEQILVYEYMPNGTLSQHLNRERGRGLPWTVRLRIAARTARAIAYLHSETNPPIFHRDIKSNNILLDFEYNSKVADFGLSRLGVTEANDSHISTAPQGTPGYLDPQYHQQFHLSDKSDVYSFGVVLVEIITALKVVDFGRPHSEVNLAALALDRIGRGCIHEIVDPLIDPHQDSWTLSSIHKVAELAFRCLAYHQDVRPSMTEVAEELQLIQLGGCALSEENVTCIGSSSVASSSSSSYGRSERSCGSASSVKKGDGSRRLYAQQYHKKPYDARSSMEKRKDKSPISAHDSWLSNHRSSPSAKSLLRTMVP